ncbi:MAG: hypothetical protein WC943_03825, partial [Elusimicrobiota bacterium]
MKTIAYLRRTIRRLPSPRKLLSLALAVSLVGPGPLPWVGASYAQTVPQRISYQGRLTDTLGNPASGDHDFVFSIHDALAAGTQLWTETQNDVPVVNGVFTVSLGAGTAIPPGVFDRDTVYLQINVDGSDMSPRDRLLAVPFAFNSALFNGQPSGSFVSTTTLAQTIAGDKTFTGAVVVPAPTLAGHAATRGYVDGVAGGGWTKDGLVVKLASSGDNAVIQSTLTVQGEAFSVGGTTLAVRDGFVGIGTTSPGRFLTIKRTGGGEFIRLEDTSSKGILGTISSNFLIRADNNAAILFDTWNGSSYGERVRITKDGGVGVGTSSPQEALHVSSSSAVVDFGIRASTLTFAAGLTADPTAAPGMLYYNASTNKLRLYNGAWADVATGASGNYVSKTGDSMTGQLTMWNSTITISGVQGNAFSVGISTLAVRDGRVGIGTSLPATALDLVGKLTWRSDLDANDYLTFMGSHIDGRMKLTAYDDTHATTFQAMMVNGRAVGLGGSSYVVGDGITGNLYISDNDTVVTGAFILGNARPLQSSVGTGKSLMFGLPDNIVYPGYGEAGIADMGTFSTIGNTWGGTRPAIRYTAYDHQFRVNGGTGETNPGTEVLRLASSGSVGVGTTSPQEKLHVSSGSAVVDFGIRASTLTFAAGLTADPTPASGMLYYNASTNKLRLYNGSWADVTTGASNSFVSKTGDSMTGQLTVRGASVDVSSITTLGAIGIGGIDLGNGTLVVKSTSTDATNPVVNIQNNAGTELMRVQQDGKIGVGTTQPAQTLSVTGSLGVSGSVGFGTTNPGAKLEVQGSAQIGNDGVNTYSLKLQRLNTDRAVAHFFAGPNDSPWLQYGENLVWSGERAGTVDNTLAYKPYYEGFAPAVGNKEFGFVNKTAGAFTSADMEPSMVLKSNGTIGIGTTSPQEKLHVSSGSAVVDFGIRTSTLTFAAGLTADPTPASGMLYYNASTNKLRLYSGAWADVTTGASGSFVSKAGDSMTGQLTVRGASVDVSSISALGAVGIGGIDLGNGTLVVKSTSTDATNPVVNIQNNAGTELIRVQQNGRVGIGFTNPGFPLHINGSAAFSDQVYAGGATVAANTASKLIIPAGAMLQGGAPTVNGSYVQFTNNAATDAGYGVWSNFNAYWDGSAWRQPRGSLGSVMGSSNWHLGWTWQYAANGGSDDGVITPTEVAKLNSSGNLQLDGTLKADGAGDSSFAGSLGVGTTAPQSKLHVSSGSAVVDFGIRTSTLVFAAGLTADPTAAPGMLYYNAS